MKLTLTQKIRSIFNHSRRLRLEVLEDRRLLSAVTVSAEEESTTFVCGTCSCGEEHDHSGCCCVELEEPTIDDSALVELKPQAELEDLSGVTDLIFSEDSTVQTFSQNSTMGVALPATSSSETVHSASELTIALNKSGVSEITIASDFQYATGTSAYTYTSSLYGQIYLSRSLTINSLKKDFTMQAAGTTDGRNIVFYVNSGYTLTLDGVNIGDCFTGIACNGGTVVFRNGNITNAANCGINNSKNGSVDFRNGTISNSGVAAIYNTSGTVKIQNLIVDSSDGYALYNSGTMTGSQILVYNVNNKYNMLWLAGGSTTFYHCTFSGTGKTPVYIKGGEMKLYNSIVTGSSDSYTVWVEGGSIAGSGNILNSASNTDFGFITATPVFDSAYSLQTTSAGFDSISSDTYCLDVDGNTLTTDLYGNDRTSGAATDIGAVEKLVSVTPLVTPANVQITADASTPEKLTVSWDAVANAVSYKVKYQVSHPECETSAWYEKTISGGTEWTVELIESTTLAVQIIACGDYVLYSNSDPSAKVEGTVRAVSFNETTLVNETEVNVLHLHSNPEATRKIYLDFTGHLTHGTSWNTADYGGDLIVTRTYSRDDSTDFSDTELQQMYMIWESVAEDYAPFDVDVTTEFPGVESLKKNGSSDVSYGIRAVLGTTIQFVENGCNWGGISYVGSFSWNSDTCNFISLMTASAMKEAASHEIGHSLGLYHRGGGSYSSGEYSYGVKISDGQYVSASGAWDSYVWCPIMGGSYYTTMTQWSDGNYYNANWSRSGGDLGDLATINTYIPYRTDDYSGTITGTTGTLVVAEDGTVSTLGDVTLENSDFSYSGIITDRNDTDVFVLTLTSDYATVDLKISGSTYANLDVYAALYSSSDLTTALLESDDFDSIDAEISLSGLMAGTYYLAIDGVGKYGTNGIEYYSDYDSLGFYTISGTVAYPAPLETPVLKFSEVTTSSITVSWQEIANAAGYEVRLGEEVYTTSSTRYSVSGLNPNTQYSISVTAVTSDSSYYTSSTGTATQTTLEAPIPAALSMEYGSTLPALTFTGGWQAGDVVKYSLSPEGDYSTTTPDFSAKNVGDYTLYLKVERDGLEIWAGSTSVTVTPQVIYASEITWTNDVATYNGSTQTVSASYGNVALTVTPEKAFCDAGTYTASVQVSDSNYTLATDAQTHTLTMNKYTVSSVTWSVPDLTYTGKAQESNVSASFTFNGSAMALNFTTYGDDASSIVNLQNAGDYTLQAELADSLNFQWASTVTNRTTSASIAKYAITLKDADWETTRSFVYDGETHSIAATFKDLADSTTNILMVSSTGKNVGEYTLTATLGADYDANYTLSGQTTQTVSITPKSVAVSFEGLDGPYTYTAQDQRASISASAVGVGTDEIPVTLSFVNQTDSTTEFKTAGTYTVTATTTNTNYTLTNATATTVMNKCSIETLTWTNADGWTYDGTAHTVTAAFTDQEGQTRTVASESFTDAGSYTVTAQLSEALSANYEFSKTLTTSQTVTVARREITSLDWTIDSQVWNPTDHLTYDGQTHTAAASFTFAGVKHETTVVCGDDASSVVNAGNYVFTASLTGSEDQQNFLLAESAKTETLTIDRKTLDVQTEIQWSETQFTYDAQPHTVSASFKDLKTGEPAALNVTYGDDASSVVNVGTYALTAALTEEQAKNYVLSETATNTAQVIEFEITEIVWTVPDLVYSGTTKTISAQYRDCDGELKTFDAELVTEKDGQTFQNVGDYVFQLAVPSPNYKFSSEAETTKAVSVTPFIIDSITWDGWENLVYDGKAHTVTASFTDALGTSQFVTVGFNDAGSVVPASIVNAGTYTLTAALGDWAANYAFDSGLVRTKDVTVAPREVSEITWSERILTYTGEEQTVTASFKDVTDANHSLTVTVNEEKTLLNADAYTVTATMNDSNYVFVPELETTAEVTIQKYTIQNPEVTWVRTENLVYDGNEHEITAYFMFNEKNYALEIYGDDASSVVKLQNAGTYTLTAALKDSETQNFELNIDPKTITVAKAKIMADDVTWSETTFSYNAQPHEITASAFGVDLTVTPDETIQNAGDYTVSASLTHPNYELGEEITHAAKVTPFQIGTIDWGTTTLTYSDDLPEQTLSPTFLNWNSESISLTYTISDGKTLSDVGTYTVVANLPADAQNYVFSAGNTAEITITPLKRATPTNLSVVGTTQGAVHVTWISTDSDFTLEYSLNEDFSEAETVNPTTCEAAIEGLTVNETYYFRVRANYADGNHENSDFTEPVAKEILPIVLQGVLIAGTEDPESESTSTEGIPENSSTFYSWDPVTVEVWTESIQQVTAGNTVQMNIAVDPEKYKLDEDSVQSMDGVTLKVTSGDGEFLLEFTIEETWSGETTPAIDELRPVQAASEINALRLGAITFTPIYKSTTSGESSSTFPISINGETPAVTPTVTRVCYDLVEDGEINISDLVAFAKQFGQQSSESGTYLAGDFDHNGEVAINDLVWFAKNFNLNATNSEQLTFPKYNQNLELKSVNGISFAGKQDLQDLEITRHKTLNESLAEN